MWLISGSKGDMEWAGDKMRELFNDIAEIVVRWPLVVGSVLRFLLIGSTDSYRQNVDSRIIDSRGLLDPNAARWKIR